MAPAQKHDLLTALSRNNCPTLSHLLRKNQSLSAAVWYSRTMKHAGQRYSTPLSFLPVIDRFDSNTDADIWRRSRRTGRFLEKGLKGNFHEDADKQFGMRDLLSFAHSWFRPTKNTRLGILRELRHFGLKGSSGMIDGVIREILAQGKFEVNEERMRTQLALLHGKRGSAATILGRTLLMLYLSSTLKTQAKSDTAMQEISRLFGLAKRDVEKRVERAIGDLESSKTAL